MSSLITPTLQTQSQPEGEQGSLPSIQRIHPKDLSGEHKTVELLEDENWQSWHDDIELMSSICGLSNYVDGTLKCPNRSKDPVGASNWKFNDNYTKKIIRERISQGQKHYVNNCQTSNDMWTNLLAIHQFCGDHTQNQLMRKLMRMMAQDDNDIIGHLNNITKLWDCMTIIHPGKLPMEPSQFK